MIVSKRKIWLSFSNHVFIIYSCLSPTFRLPDSTRDPVSTFVRGVLDGAGSIKIVVPVTWNVKVKRD